MTILPRYIHIVNTKLKHTYLSFDEEANLIIKSPKISQRYLEQLLLKKSSWITRSQEKIREKKGRSTDAFHHGKLYFNGLSYPLHLEQHLKKHAKLLFDDEAFTLFYGDYDEVLFKRHIDRFYKERAREHISPLVEQWAKKMQVDYEKLSFRKSKRQWGSCSGKNYLSFNTMAMKLPPDVLQYLIVHELTHITHKHHQKAFWEHLAAYLPDYKVQVATLKTYTTH